MHASWCIFSDNKLTFARMLWDNLVEIFIIFIVLVQILHSPGAKGRFWLWIMKVAGPTENLYILNAEVVLIPVFGAVCPDLWEIY